jgi:NAD(P)-dependent dehydrogenase (short-subunit alcohol dehydrogenase family)
MVVLEDRVTPLILDVTNRAQIQEAVASVNSLDILINNAGVSVPDDLSERSAFERHLAVNLYGTLDVTQAFVPSLTRRHGADVNVVSLSAVAAVPVLPAYSVSKAALLSATQSLRALLAGRGVSVHAVTPGPIDTEMVRALEIPKAPPDVVARAALDGVERATRPAARLLSEARAGDEKACGHLASRHRPGLELYCQLMLGCPHRAHEAVCETLLRGWRDLDRVAPSASARIWLYRLATDVCLEDRPVDR